ncbi:hypothetical protein FMS18_19930 [Desulfovibrio sp. JC022]|nr:hypothetical protein [Desulfovibrio sp. JC022]
MEELLSGNLIQAINLKQVIIGLVLILLSGMILAWHYRTYAHVFSNKNKVARIFPLIGTTAFLLIITVKSSLALSLGCKGHISPFYP